MKYEPNPKQHSNGRFFIKVSNDDDSRVLVQLNNSKLNSDLSEDNISVVIHAQCQKIITDLDAATVSAAMTNCSSWFGKELSVKTLESAFSMSLADSIIDVSKLAIKNKILTKVYDHTKTEITADAAATTVVSGTVCDVLLEYTGVWFLKKTYGLVWRLVQIRLKPPPKKTHADTYLFQDDVEESSDDDDDLY